VSARTGGLASSYASSAGADAYNYYMGQLGDKELDLLAQGEQRHAAGKNDIMNLLGIYTNQDATAYGRYRDTVGDARYEQEYADTMEQRDLENSRWNMQWNNELGRQGVEDERWNTQYGDTRNDANFTKAQTLLSMGFSTTEIAGYLGITQEQADQYAAMVQSGMKADIDARNRSNTGSSGGGGGGKPRLTAAQVNAAIKAGTVTSDVLAAYEYYYGAPYTGGNGGDEDMGIIDKMLSYGNDARAKEYLYQQSGLSDSETDELWYEYETQRDTVPNGALTKKQWESIKVWAGSPGGKFGGMLGDIDPDEAAAAAYDSYEEYLADFRQFARGQ
jgi:hypothetical protein